MALLNGRVERTERWNSSFDDVADTAREKGAVDSSLRVFDHCDSICVHSVQLSGRWFENRLLGTNRSASRDSGLDTFAIGLGNASV